MANEFDPFGWDDDISFDPDELDEGEVSEDGNIDDIAQFWDFALDYDYEDLQTYEFHGTGDTGGGE